MINKEDDIISDRIPQFLEHYESVLFDKVNNEIRLIPPMMYLIKAQMLAILAPTLLQHKLESREDVLVYNPQKVLRQLGDNQGVVRSVGDMSYSSALVAENKFVSKSRVEFLLRAHWLFCPRLGREGLFARRNPVLGEVHRTVGRVCD